MNPHLSQDKIILTYKSISLTSGSEKYIYFGEFLIKMFAEMI